MTTHLFTPILDNEKSRNRIELVTRPVLGPSSEAPSGKKVWASSYYGTSEHRAKKEDFQLPNDLWWTAVINQRMGRDVNIIQEAVERSERGLKGSRSNVASSGRDKNHNKGIRSGH